MARTTLRQLPKILVASVIAATMAAVSKAKNAVMPTTPIGLSPVNNYRTRATKIRMVHRENPAGTKIAKQARKGMCTKFS